LENSLGLLIRLFNAYGVCIPREVVKGLFFPSTIQLLKKDHPEFFEHKDFVGDADLDTIRKRHDVSYKKLRLAKKRFRLLQFIPWIKFVAVSGSVAFYSAKRQDDIDIFIVTSPKRLWIVRGLMVVFLSLFGWRRKFGKNDLKDKFCLNYFVTSDNLNLRQSPEEDFLTALEILMLKPIYNANYLDFVIWQNRYIGKFFPKVYDEAVNHVYGKELRVPFLSGLLDALDNLAMEMQIIYMKLLKHPVEKSVIKRDKAQFFSPKGWKHRKELIGNLNKEDVS
jgi:hypothetical protein